MACFTDSLPWQRDCPNRSPLYRVFSRLFLDFRQFASVPWYCINLESLSIPFARCRQGGERDPKKTDRRLSRQGLSHFKV